MAWTVISIKFSRPSAVVDVRANVTLIGFLIDELTDVFARAIVNIFSGLGIVVEGNVLAAVVVTALEFTISPSLKETLCFCWASLTCWPVAALDCARGLQAWMPSYHVWSRFALPVLPQFLNQEPPKPQQLVLPDFLMVPHFGHTKLVVIMAVVSGVYVHELSKDIDQKDRPYDSHCAVWVNM